jgi:tol-pal system protein YbgF
MRGRLLELPNGQTFVKAIGRPIAAGLLLCAALGAGLGTIAPSAHAGLFDDEEARKAIIEIRARLTEQQRSIDGLGKQASDLSGKIDKSVEPAMRSQLDLQNQIETMRQEIAKLRGQLEVQTNELAQTQKRQRDVYADLDTRLKKYEPSQVQVDGKTVAVDQNEKRTYEAALAQFRAGDFKTAQAGFQTFIAQYPDSAFTPSAIFWMGSAQFALKDYKNTITTNQLFLGKYSDHPRAPDALLNVAYAQIETGDRRTARKTLETVVEKYADTPAAQTAKERMTSLR